MQQEEKLFNYNYCMVLLGNLIAYLGYTMVMSNIAPYAASLQVDGVLLGVIPGLMSIAALCCRPFSGIISDLCKRKHILVFSFAGLSLVFVGYAFSEHVWMLLLVRMLHGVFFCLCTTVNLTMVADLVPEKKLAQRLGYYGLCYTFMSAVGPEIGLALSKRAGYRNMFLCAAALYGLAFLVSLSIRMNDRKKEEERQGEKRSFSLSGLFSREALPASGIAFFNAFTNGAVVSFILLYAAEKGFANAGMFFTVYAVVIVASRPLLGGLADEWQPQYLVFPCDGLIIASMVLLFAANRAWHLYLAAILYGIGYGGLQPLLQSMGLRSARPQERGRASGTFNIGLDGGNGLGPVLCSTAAGAFGGYPYGFLAMIVPVLLGACIMAELVKREKKQTLKRAEHSAP